MNRDEFMELVYETFVDEPDNVLANGIIEAADAYVEHEKAQLFSEGATPDLIDRQVVIKVLERWQKAFKENSHYVSASDLSLVVKDVKELPTIQPEKAQHFSEGITKDTISRQAAIDAVEKNACNTQRIMDAVNNLPPAQPERRTGKWMPDNRAGGGFWVCSCCKFPSEAFAANVLYKFCPNCGADMRGRQNG